MVRSKSPLLAILFCTTLVLLLLGKIPSCGFTGVSAGLATARAATQPLAAGSAAPWMADVPSSLVLADLSTDAQALPVIAFVCSIFVGVIGYSLFIAFGPGAEDLRDPFEEHED
mmetsp:Transcript_14386/g.26488  ORF Transcript_14386/g.26488 Transcript_14386/m.26488 type:complete len:114 (+) Transcript_14386:89-430(+)